MSESALKTPSVSEQCEHLWSFYPKDSQNQWKEYHISVFSSSYDLLSDITASHRFLLISDSCTDHTIIQLGKNIQKNVLCPSWTLHMQRQTPFLPALDRPGPRWPPLWLKQAKCL